MTNITLSEIPTLTLLYKLDKLSPSSTPTPTATPKHNDKISLLQTDITKLSLDAIVNAANETLLGGGGVDGSIHRAAGRSLLRECETLQGCSTGSAKITQGYHLPAKHVIHAVGPIYRSSRHEECEELLRSCYTSSLNLAVENGCRSVAFPGISTGIYGYPLEEAVRTAVESVKGWLEADEERARKVDRVVFCQYLGREQAVYEHFAPMYFSPEVEEGEDKGGGEIGDKDEVVKEEVANLPDVPRTNPGEADQPEPKKTKLDRSEDEVIEDWIDGVRK